MGLTGCGFAQSLLMALSCYSLRQKETEKQSTSLPICLYLWNSRRCRRNLPAVPRAACLARSLEHQTSLLRRSPAHNSPFGSLHKTLYRAETTARTCARCKLPRTCPYDPYAAPPSTPYRLLRARESPLSQGWPSALTGLLAAHPSDTTPTETTSFLVFSCSSYWR